MERAAAQSVDVSASADLRWVHVERLICAGASGSSNDPDGRPAIRAALVCRRKQPDVLSMTDTRPLEYALLRQLSPAKKLAVMNGLIRQAYALKEAWVRHLEPDLPDDAVRARVRELVAGGRS